MHYDTHDVFMIQLAGCKSWELAGSFEPLQTAIFADGDARNASHDRSHVALAAGDVLYIPRGMFHEGLTSKRMSAHLTIGVHPYTRADLLRDMAHRLESQCIEFRRSAAPPTFNKVGEDASFSEMLSGLAASLNDTDLAAAVLSSALDARSSHPSIKEFRGQLSATFASWNSGGTIGGGSHE